MKKIIVVRSEECGDSNAVATKPEALEDTGYKAYIKKHGHHFSDKLAEFAISKMTNNSQADKSHTWSIKQVESVVNANGGQKTLHNTTRGDLAYLANMYYADLFPMAITQEINCIKAALAIANDPDGYEGQAFNRWVADVMAIRESIDWNLYI